MDISDSSSGGEEGNISNVMCQRHPCHHHHHPDEKYDCFWLQPSSAVEAMSHSAPGFLSPPT